MQKLRHMKVGVLCQVLLLGLCMYLRLASRQRLSHLGVHEQMTVMEMPVRKAVAQGRCKHKWQPAHAAQPVGNIALLPSHSQNPHFGDE